ncbi:MAG TPA: hypothetical protein VGP72_14285 [Planctomycetota bacterium]|jgi:hypothetical protein
MAKATPGRLGQPRFFTLLCGKVGNLLGPKWYAAGQKWVRDEGGLLSAVFLTLHGEAFTFDICAHPKFAPFCWKPEHSKPELYDVLDFGLKERVGALALGCDKWWDRDVSLIPAVVAAIRSAVAEFDRLNGNWGDAAYYVRTLPPEYVFQEFSILARNHAGEISSDQASDKLDRLRDKNPDAKGILAWSGIDNSLFIPAHAAAFLKDVALTRRYLRTVAISRHKAHVKAILSAAAAIGVRP